MKIYDDIYMFLYFVNYLCEKYFHITSCFLPPFFIKNQPFVRMVYSAIALPNAIIGLLTFKPRFVDKFYGRTVIPCRA